MKQLCAMVYLRFKVVTTRATTSSLAADAHDSIGMI